MRVILFKAKRLDNGEWVEGSLIQNHDASFIAEQDLYSFIGYCGECDRPFSDCHQVDPATVCQYTGLTDKNGVKIWEGDIILAKGTGYKAIVEWQSDSCRFLAMITNRRDETSPHFFYVDKGSDRGCQMSSSEVIGSIHDKEVTHEH